MKKPFDDFPGFYEEDNRKNRPNNPISKEMLENKHEVLLSESMVKGKSVLDLGSCLGATGQWCLFYGAREYCGVEIQKEYIEISKKLLSHHGEKVQILHQSIETFLSENTKKYDIVVLSGVIYVFLDYYKILKEVASITNEIIIIDSMVPSSKVVDLHSPAIEIQINQSINLASVNGNLYGIGTRITPPGFIILLQSLGFKNDGGILLPKKIEGHIDVYNHTNTTNTKRFLMRFVRNDIRLESLSENLQGKRDGFISKWNTSPKDNYLRAQKEETQRKWEFDKEIAKDFQKIAFTEIPHYKEVIKKCLQIGLKYYDKNAKILDVGSALGFTLHAFNKVGFTNTYGVENSKSMIEKSYQETTLIYDDCFPTGYGKFDIIMANWTLHFIRDRERYLQDILHGLNDGGMFILTEKVSSSQRIHELYYDFKRGNGLSEEHILRKQKALEGVLITHPVEWYLNQLRSLGFTSIDIIDSHYSFVTMVAMK